MVQGHEAGGQREGIGRVAAGSLRAFVDNAFLHTGEKIPLNLATNPLAIGVLDATKQLNTSPSVADAAKGMLATVSQSIKLPENGEFMSAPAIGAPPRSSTIPTV